MASILGGQQPAQGNSILGSNSLYNPLRMFTVRQPGQGQSAMAGWGGPAGGGGAYDPNAAALHYGGPGALLWRQIEDGISKSKNPLSILNAKKANQYFTDDTIGLLNPNFQKAYAKKAK